MITVAAGQLVSRNVVAATKTRGAENGMRLRAFWLSP
jgi:hypothetical protein